MRQELEEKLFTDFPLLYNKNQDIRVSLMNFGFECGDGWYDLIRELSEKLYPLVEKCRSEQDEDGYRTQACQVKEKYGSLRFYMDAATDAMFDLIEEYEDRSSRTCESCGKPGDRHNVRNWIYTTCEEHKPK